MFFALDVDQEEHKRGGGDESETWQVGGDRTRRGSSAPSARHSAPLRATRPKSTAQPHTLRRNPMRRGNRHAHESGWSSDAASGRRVFSPCVSPPVLPTRPRASRPSLHRTILSLALTSSCFAAMPSLETFRHSSSPSFTSLAICPPGAPTSEPALTSCAATARSFSWGRPSRHLFQSVKKNKRRVSPTIALPLQEAGRRRRCSSRTGWPYSDFGRCCKHARRVRVLPLTTDRGTP